MRAGWLFTWVVLIALVAVAPTATPAGVVEEATTTPPIEAAVGTDTWLGGLAAVGCGVFLRATILTGGTQVATIAGSIACCAYAVIDLVFIDPH